METRQSQVSWTIRTPMTIPNIQDGDWCWLEVFKAEAGWSVPKPQSQIQHPTMDALELAHRRPND